MLLLAPDYANKYGINVRNNCGPVNAYFISIRQVLLTVDFSFLLLTTSLGVDLT